MTLVSSFYLFVTSKVLTHPMKAGLEVRPVWRMIVYLFYAQPKSRRDIE